jgi:predicted Fe-Mo cluster-binding NifX family protein
VFDVATHVKVIEVDDGKIAHTFELRLDASNRVARLEEQSVDVLICGAISRPLEATCWVAGIEVLSEVCGPVDDVIEAYLNGSLGRQQYLSPGHAGRGPGFVEPPRRRERTRHRSVSRAGHSSRHN